MNTKHKIARILYVVGLIALPIPYLWPIDAKVEGLGAVFLFLGLLMIFHFSVLILAISSLLLSLQKNELGKPYQVGILINSCILFLLLIEFFLL